MLGRSYICIANIVELNALIDIICMNKLKLLGRLFIKIGVNKYKTMASNLG